jgi:hypothetical protein
MENPVASSGQRIRKEWIGSVSPTPNVLGLALMLTVGFRASATLKIQFA